MKTPPRRSGRPTRTQPNGTGNRQGRGSRPAPALEEPETGDDNRSQTGRPTRSARTGKRGKAGKAGAERLFLYGVHTVKAALENRKRKLHRLYATANGLDRLGDAVAKATSAGLEIREAESRDLQNLVGAEPVHQGVVLECAPLDTLDPSELFALADHDLLLVLDQVTDPHNVGAILRSAVALGAGAVVTTARHAAPESAVLAKSASGAVDMIDQMPVRNLSKCVADLADLGFVTLGLDSESPADLAETLEDGSIRDDKRLRGKPLKLAIVLGAEGKGLRQQTREECIALARLDMPGPIRSLNVSNAAVLALYLARSALKKAG